MNEWGSEHISSLFRLHNRKKVFFDYLVLIMNIWPIYHVLLLSFTVTRRYSLRSHSVLETYCIPSVIIILWFNYRNSRNWRFKDNYRFLVSFIQSTWGYLEMSQDLTAGFHLTLSGELTGVQVCLWQMPFSRKSRLQSIIFLFYPMTIFSFAFIFHIFHNSTDRGCWWCILQILIQLWRWLESIIWSWTWNYTGFTGLTRSFTRRCTTYLELSSWTCPTEYKCSWLAPNGLHSLSYKRIWKRCYCGLRMHSCPYDPRSPHPLCSSLRSRILIAVSKADGMVPRNRSGILQSALPHTRSCTWSDSRSLIRNTKSNFKRCNS